MDGGTTWNNNMVAAVNECYAMDGIENENQITVDVIVLDPLAPLDKFGSDEYLKKQQEHQDKKQKLGSGSMLPMTMQYYLRNKSIKDYNHDMKDFFKFMYANPNVNYRYLFMP